MRYRTHRFLSLAALPTVLTVAFGAATLAAQYTMTVNHDRLINAQSEPQNWLMMNGDLACGGEGIVSSGVQFDPIRAAPNLLADSCQTRVLALAPGAM